MSASQHQLLSPIRRVQIGWALATTTTHMTPVMLLVLAYERGGAALLAGGSVTLCIFGATTALGVGGLVDRFGLERSFRALVGAGSTAVVGCGLLAVSEGAIILTLALGAVGVALFSTYRPLQAAALPWLVHTPQDLARANVGAAGIESVASLVGPALAAAALLFTTPERALLGAAVLAALVPLPMLGLRVLEERAPRSAGSGRALSLLAGIPALWRTSGRGGSVVLVALQTFARGALQVLLVVLVLTTFGAGDDVVGWLWAALGVGGMLGAASGSLLLRYSHLGRSFVLGVGLWGVGLVIIAAAGTSPWIAAIGMLVLGLGNAVEDASMFTFVARVAPREHVVRALSAIEVIAFSAMALGSVAAPGLIGLVGDQPALAWLGVVVGGVALTYFWTFRAADRSGGARAGHTDLLAAVDIFEALPVVVVEHLASQLQTHDHDPGEVVMREGEPGDRYHVIVTGTATVSVAGSTRPTLGPGEGFGEIALLREGPRTATVIAAAGFTTVSLGREEFLTALQGRSATAEVLATRRLESGPAAP